MNLFSKHKTRRLLLKAKLDLSFLPTLLRQWYQTPQGLAVLEAEKAIAKPIISRLFGYHILQVGQYEAVSFIEDSPVSHKIIFAPNWSTGVKYAVADNEELPLATDTIDVVVVHHALDFTRDSHQLLREVTRVLRPGGQMLIIGFNPMSYWGLWRLFKRKNQIPWRGRFISKRRLKDWLQLLNCQVDKINYGLHFLPVKCFGFLEQIQKNEQLGQKYSNPLGGAYFILCTKQVTPITPIVPRWRSLRSPANVIPLAENLRTKSH